MTILRTAYEKLILDNPKLTLLIVMLLTVILGVQALNFRLDASSESLSLENDQAVKYYRSVKTQYGSDDYLVVTYTPQQHEHLFHPDNLLKLQALRNDLIKIQNVKSLTSILDVPLTQSPPVSLIELNENIRKLNSSDTDIAMARQELISSPFYKDLLISRDGKTTALLVLFHEDDKLNILLDKLENLRQKAAQRALTKQEESNLAQVEKAYKEQNAYAQKQQINDIAAIRSALEGYQEHADIHLGGVPMIVADSIDFIRSDLRVFGLGVLALIISLLALFFRKPQWIVIPMVTCFCVAIWVTGFLGLVNWPVTVVSSNFISLLLIFTLSFCVHQIVCYRECAQNNPDFDQRRLVQLTMRSIGLPCFYMVLTTMVAFGSLVISDIRPIIDFGWMMMFGLGVSYVLSFLIMPSVLMLIKPEKTSSRDGITVAITGFFAHLIHSHGKIILLCFSILMILSVWGTSQLSVQNRFIDYYKKDTEIYRGMETIDTKLGGTTPMDIVIDAPQSFLDYQKEEAEMMEEDGFGVSESDAILGGYWFSDIMLKQAGEIHTYLESLPEVGKVLSFYSAIQLLENLKDSQKLDRFYLGVIYNNLPKDAKDLLLWPYISGDGNQLRFSVRVYESQKGVNRQELLAKIQTHLIQKIELKDEQVNLTGMVVLYNNILQSLFSSQILTLWIVFVAMFLMFFILFRNIWIALVAIVPNIAIAAFVLGTMGWLGIPLDIMTITIAAICLGISADDTIHYVYRFMEEFKKSGEYKQAIERSHMSIGRAMYYTSMTIALGFSILTFSSFVPTIYFGILTGASMIIALLGDIILLPLLLLLIKPLGKT